MSVSTSNDAIDRPGQIRQVAAELFASTGAKATTMRQIAAAVGVKAGSIYHHFPSKDDILAEILGAYLTDLNECYRRELKADLSSADLIRSLIETSLGVSGRHPHAAEVYQTEQAYLRNHPDLFDSVLAAGRESQTTWTEAIRRGYEDGTFRQDIAAETFHRLLRDALWMSVRWYRPSADYTTKDFAADIAAVFLDGYLHRDG